MNTHTNHLVARAHQTRVAALSTARDAIAAHRTRELGELDRRRAEVIAKSDADEREAVRAVERRAVELEVELASEVVARIPPILRRFADTPRAAALDASAAWRELQTRAHEELATPIDPRHLVFAFAEVHDVLAQSGSAGYQAGIIVGRADPALMGWAGPEIEAELRRLEAAVVEQARQTRHGAADRLRYIRRWATWRAVVEASNRFDSIEAALRGDVKPMREQGWALSDARGFVEELRPLLRDLSLDAALVELESRTLWWVRPEPTEPPED